MDTQELNKNYLYVIMAYHSQNGGKIDNYLEFVQNFEFTYKDNNIQNPFIIYRWDLSSPQPTYEQLLRIENYQEYKTKYKLILQFDSQPTCLCVNTETRTFLTNYSKQGSLLFDTDEKKFYIFYDNNWN